SVSCPQHPPFSLGLAFGLPVVRPGSLRLRVKEHHAARHASFISDCYKLFRPDEIERNVVGRRCTRISQRSSEQSEGPVSSRNVVNHKNIKCRNAGRLSIRSNASVRRRQIESEGVILKSVKSSRDICVRWPCRGRSSRTPNQIPCQVTTSGKLSGHPWN